MDTVSEGSEYNFQGLVRVSVPTKHICQNFGFGDLRSGQCCDLAIIQESENVEMPFIPKLRVGGCYISRPTYSYIRPL